MTILEYVKNKKTKIDTTQHVDALLLALSIYFEFEKIPSFQEKLPLRFAELVSEVAHEPFKLNEKSTFRKNHVYLMHALLENPIFANIQIVDFQCEAVEEIEKQFAAITYLIDETHLFIAFRGTDATMLGWKEDFNMTYSEYVPSQQSAKVYVNNILSQYPLDAVISGHSKGGNMAVYATVKSDDMYLNQIKQVYNFDGPGFQTSFVESERYDDILALTKKYVPQFSFFGTLLNSSEPLFIVKSKSISLYQHDPYSWLIEDGHFLFAEEATPLSRQLSTSISTWLKDISNEQRSMVIDEIYKGLKQLNVKTTDDLWGLLSIQSMKEISFVYNDVDPEIRLFVKEIVKQLLKIFFFSRETENQSSFFRKYAHYFNFK